jgi:hypothetical protein
MAVSPRRTDLEQEKLRDQNRAHTVLDGAPDCLGPLLLARFDFDELFGRDADGLGAVAKFALALRAELLPRRDACLHASGFTALAEVDGRA